MVPLTGRILQGILIILYPVIHKSSIDILPSHILLGSSFAGKGVCDGELIVEAKFGLRHFNLADENSAMAEYDAIVIENLKKRFGLLDKSS